MDDLDLGQTLRGFAAGQKVFGRYTLARLLGRGGMGVVWLARDEELEQEVALKFLPEVVMGDNGAIDDMRRETRRARELTHPNIVRIHDFLRDSRMAAISMEYVAGDSLGNRRLELPARVFEPAELAKWVEQLCGALEYAHTMAKIVHRDLKPANLMVDARGDLKIADFGISATLSDTTTRVSKHAGSSGTPVYMSPQQMMGEKPAATDDIYSLGATLYELLTGKPPFYTGNVLLQVQNKVPPSVAARREELATTVAGAGGPGIPSAWEETLAACLAKDPAQRPQRASEVWRRLNGEVSPVLQLAPSAQPALLTRSTSPTQSHPQRRRSKLLLALGLVAVLAVVGTAGWYYGIQQPEQSRRKSITRLDAERQRAEQERLAELEKAEVARLEKARGGLVVKTVPAEAEVQVGAVAFEKAPFKLNELKLGKYPVRARLEGYDEWKGEAEVVEGVYSEFSIRLTRSRGTLTIRSPQPGIHWSLAKTPEGEILSPKEGETPLTLKNLPTGTYVVEFAEASGVRTRETVEVRAGEMASIEHSIRSGDLSLASNLSAATWEVQSASQDIILPERQGAGPGNVADLPVGKYTVTFRCEGWPEIRKEIEVKGADTVNVAAEFDAGDIEIDSTPRGAEVFDKDGVLLGETPLALREIRPGAFSVSIKKDGYETKKLSGIVQNRESLKLDAAMAVHPAVPLAVRIRALNSNEENDAVGKPCDELLAMADVPAKEKAIALLSRGMAKRVAGNFDDAARDFTQVIDDPKAPAVWRAQAFTQRGIVKTNLNDKSGAQADHTTAIEMSTRLIDDKAADVETRAQTLETRAISKGWQGDAAGGISDYTDVINMVGTPVEELCSALLGRGHILEEKMDYAGEIADCQAVTRLAAAPLNKKALAMNNIAVAKWNMKDVEGAIAAYSETIKLGIGVLPQFRSRAFNERSKMCYQLKRWKEAIASASAVIEMKSAGILPDVLAQAYYTRGISKGNLGDLSGADVDMMECVKVEGADEPTKQMARELLVKRGIYR